MSNDDASRIRSQLQSVSTADVADALRKRGVTKVVLRGMSWFAGAKTCAAGPARTLRLLPDREDKTSPPTRSVNRTLYDSIEQGEVLMIDALGDASRAAVGDMILGRVRARGAAAVVVDGAIRDVSFLAQGSMPVLARSTSPASFAGWLKPAEADGPINCGGVLVEPGDWIVCDADGAVVVPSALAGSVATVCVEQRRLDEFSTALIGAGFGLDDAYPLPRYMARFLSDYRVTGKLPTLQEVADARAEATRVQG